MKAAVYLRVSTDRQDEANQEPDCHAVCLARGWQWVDYHERESGVRYRPKWAQLIADARAGRIRAVVVWSLDRIGRRMWDVVADIRELARVGCEVVSVRESRLDTGGPARDLLLAVFAWVAQFEHERLSARTKAGLARARATGKVIGRPSELGARWLAEAVAMRQAGLTWKQTTEALSTLAGTAFRPTQVSQAVRRAVRSGAKPGPDPPATKGEPKTAN